MNNKRWIGLVMFLALAVPVTAQGPVARGFELLWEIFQNPFVIWGFTFLFYFIFFYAVISGGLSKIKVFRGDNGPNKQGRVVAGSLAALMDISILFTTRGQDVEGVLTRVLNPFGIIGPLALGIIIFAIVYYSFKDESGGKDWRLAVGCAGLAMIVVGMSLKDPGWTAWGWLFLLVALVGFLSGGIGRIGRDAPEGSDVRSDSDTERKRRDAQEKYRRDHPESGWDGRGWDPDNLVSVQFHVSDMAERKLPGAKVSIQSGDRKGRAIEVLVENNGLTDKRDIPSGEVYIKVHWNYRWYSPLLKLLGRTARKSVYFLNPEEDYTEEHAIRLKIEMGQDGKIYGKVFDAHTKLAIPGAELTVMVQLEKGEPFTRADKAVAKPTNDKGEFKITRAPRQLPLVVRARKEGYRENNNVDGDKTKVIGFNPTGPFTLQEGPLGIRRPKQKDVAIYLMREGAAPPTPERGGRREEPVEPAKPPPEEPERPPTEALIDLTLTVGKPGEGPFREVHLAWKWKTNTEAQQNAAQGYTVLRTPVWADTDDKPIPEPHLSKEQNEYVDPAARAGKKYTYQIVALNAEGNAIAMSDPQQIEIPIPEFNFEEDTEINLGALGPAPE